MGKVVQYRSPQAQHDWTASLGMIVFLGSWAMMFGSLFFAYGIIRAHSVAWPPPDLPHIPLLLPAINTVALGLSSAALQRCSSSMARDAIQAGALAIAAAAFLGLVFLALQCVVWVGLVDQGLTPRTGGYASVFYIMTTFHAFHVLIGLGALVWLCRGVFQGKYNAARHLPIRLWTMYWHFVGVVWGLMFVMLYLI